MGDEQENYGAPLGVLILRMIIDQGLTQIFFNGKGVIGFLFMLRAIHYISIAKTRIDGIILN